MQTEELHEAETTPGLFGEGRVRVAGSGAPVGLTG
jgi:hypothetical protein